MSASSDGAPTPRQWVGEGQFPWPPVRDLADGDPVRACFSILQLTPARSGTAEPCTELQLADCYGTVRGRACGEHASAPDVLRVGGYIGIGGHMVRGELQIDEISPVRVELDDLVLFMPRSARSADDMEAELAALIASIGDNGLRALLTSLLGADSEVGQAFRLAPAAKQNHHAYLGGLLEHTLSVAMLCDVLTVHYDGMLDRDLLIAGALLHDIGKVREIGARAGFPYTDEGKLIGHIVIGMQMVADAARHAPLDESRLLLLQHLIASHQGRFEWHSPREPRILEGIVLHYADDLDAKLNQAAALVAAVPAGWSGYDRSFGREFLHHFTPPVRALDAPVMPRRGRATDAPSPKEPPGLQTLDLFEQS